LPLQDGPKPMFLPSVAFQSIQTLENLTRNGPPRPVGQTPVLDLELGVKIQEAKDCAIDHRLPKLLD
jgi:hypothetical protein